MSRSSRVLFLGGWTLALLGMSYGLWYALFDEHQTLEQMGSALAESFVHAAEGDLPAAHMALKDYAGTQAEYVREVHAHGHWIVLAMVMIALGLAFDRVNLPEKVRYATAWLMGAGSAAFPLGVLLGNILMIPALLADGLAIVGAAAVILALALTAIGMLRNP